MSIFDSARRAFIGRDYDDYDEEYYDEEEYEEEPPKRSFFSFLSRNKDEEEYEEENTSKRYTSDRNDYSSSYRNSSASRNTGMNQTPVSLSGVELSIISPTSFDESSRIVKEVKNGKITVFDMSGITDVEEARRIVDYICGAAEGMDCPFSRICPSVFCIAPKGVVINGKRTRY